MGFGLRGVYGGLGGLRRGFLGGGGGAAPCCKARRGSPPLGWPGGPLPETGQERI